MMPARMSWAMERRVIGMFSLLPAGLATAISWLAWPIYPGWLLNHFASAAAFGDRLTEIEIARSNDGDGLGVS